MRQLRENRPFTVRFVAVVAALTAIVSLLLKLQLGLEIPILLPFTGTVAMVALLVSTLLNRLLWRIWPFSAVLQIPVFAGRWEGWYRRAPGEPWRETAHEISQKALDIDAEAWGPRNWSRGTCSAVIVASSGLTKELVWAYKTEPTTTDYVAGDAHAGVHFLRMVEECGQQLLIGRYINDRANQDGHKGAVGEIRVKWVSEKLQHALNLQGG
jgi:hypothetical protein